MCKRGAERVIMACDDVEVGQDVAVEIRGETNGDIIVDHCYMVWYDTYFPRILMQKVQKFTQIYDAILRILTSQRF